MSEKNLSLFFFDIEVSISTENSDLVDRLRSDFSFFQKTSNVSHSIRIKANLVDSLSSEIAGKCIYKSSEVKVFEDHRIRYSNYNDEALSIWEYVNDQVEFTSLEINLLHEIVYLFILSRVGKILDERGVHRLHASAFSIDGTLLVATMPSGFGKSTLASFIIDTKQASLFSDDSPLIDSCGKVHEFPIRLGFESKGLLPDSWKEKDSYTLVRRKFGEKKLFSIDSLSCSLGGPYHSSMILLGSKERTANPKIKEVSKIWAIKQLFVEGVIGFGLPILVEYFWLLGLSDFLLKTKIFFSRLRALSRLLLCSRVFKLKLSDDPKRNADFLIEWAKTKKGT